MQLVTEKSRIAIILYFTTIHDGFPMHLSFSSHKSSMVGREMGPSPFLGYKLQHTKWAFIHVKSTLHVCMYMYDKVLLEKSTFKNDFYFSYFLLTYNPIAPFIYVLTI